MFHNSTSSAFLAAFSDSGNAPSAFNQNIVDSAVKLDFVCAHFFAPFKLICLSTVFVDIDPLSPPTPHTKKSKARCAQKSEFTTSPPGLPDFSWYNIPNGGKYTK
jgi:hypothetical protein